MSETGEGNPAGNFKKTVIAQQERMEAAEKPTGLVDRFIGQHIRGKVSSSFDERYGGYVSTTLDSGSASMDQTWHFDKDGNINKVDVSRKSGDVEASIVTLERGDDGKFRVKEERSNVLLKYWHKGFNTVQKRMQAHRDIPSNPKPQIPQK